MLSTNRSGGRDVFIADAKEPGTVLGGVISNKGMTNALLYALVETVCAISSAYVLRHDRGGGRRGSNTVLRDSSQPLRPGKYYIVTQGSVAATQETPLFRAGSLPGSPRGQPARAFQDAVRRRDRICVVAGDGTQADRDDWTGFDAAHVFPLAHEEHWVRHNFGRFVTVAPAIGGAIHSVQNGLLLRSDLHQLFDAYDLAINPDDSHRVVVFGTDSMHVSGRLLAQSFLASPQRAPDALLRWHFRQAVLANVKGAGSPVLESDSDVLAAVYEAPMAAERMDLEVFCRLVASKMAEEGGPGGETGVGS